MRVWEGEMKIPVICSSDEEEANLFIALADEEEAAEEINMLDEDNDEDDMLDIYYLYY